MTTDKELLELAAKAAGIEFCEYHQKPAKVVSTGIGDARVFWNPLTDDGDALRLAVKVGICITPYPIYNEEERHSVIAKQRRRSDTMRENNPTEVVELYNTDPNAATRRAIVRAAAEVGKGMLTQDEFVAMFPDHFDAEIGKDMK